MSLNENPRQEIMEAAITQTFPKARNIEDAGEDFGETNVVSFEIDFEDRPLKVRLCNALGLDNNFHAYTEDATTKIMTTNVDTPEEAMGELKCKLENL